jgi:hypothetical protein
MAMAAMKRLPVSGRPTPQECKAVIEALAQLHGRPNRHQHSAGLQPGCELKEPHTVLDSLVRHSAVWPCCDTMLPGNPLPATTSTSSSDISQTSAATSD